MKRIYKNIFLLFIFFTINIFSSKDAIIAPKKYKPAEMNLEITKVKLKEIEGIINEVKKELYISKKDLAVDTDDILFITEEKNKLRENFNFQKKDILNNENYVFSYKQHKDNIYLVHSDKEKIKGIYKILIIKNSKTPSAIVEILNSYEDFTFQADIKSKTITKASHPFYIYTQDQSIKYNLKFKKKQPNISGKYRFHVGEFQNSIEIKNKKTNQVIFLGKLTTLNFNPTISGVVSKDLNETLTINITHDIDLGNLKNKHLIIKKQPADQIIIEKNNVDFGYMTSLSNKIKPDIPGSLILKNLKTLKPTIQIVNSNILLKNSTKEYISAKMNISSIPEIINDDYIFYINGEATAGNISPGNYSGILSLQLNLQPIQGGKF